MKKSLFKTGVYSFLILVASFSFQSCSKEADVIEETVSAEINNYLKLINDVRAEGCSCGGVYYAPAPAISWNPDLAEAAERHSKDMNVNKFFSHTGSDGSNTDTRIAEAGYPYRRFGENIARGFDSYKTAVNNGWLKSTGHCKNIMNPEFTEIGVSESGGYWTQVFGKQK